MNANKTSDKPAMPELPSEAAVQCSALLVHLSVILQSMREEEAERNGQIYAYKPTPEEEEYLAQFNATKVSVLKAIERCANAEAERPAGRKHCDSQQPIKEQNANQ